MKKIRCLSAFLVLAMLLTLLSGTALAYDSQYNKVQGDWQYSELEDGTLKLEYYFGKATSVTVPSKLKSKTVTALGSSAFWENLTLTSVSIPASVKSIGSNAFYGCVSLANIKLPAGLTSIGLDAFGKTQYAEDLSHWEGRCLYYGTYLLDAKVGYDSSIGGYPSSVSVRAGTTLIADYAFGSSRLTSVSLPGSLRYIGSNVFADCASLSSLTIPSGVKAIGSRAFAGCTGLTSMTLPDTVKTLGSGLFRNNTALKTVKLPTGLTELPDSLFFNCTAIKTVTIPSKVSAIRYSAFEGCTALTGVTLPAAVRQVEMSAFKDCTKLTSVTLPKNLEYLGSYAFENCTGLTSVNIPAPVNSLNGYTFYNCTALKTLKIHSGVSYVGDYSFGYGGYSGSTYTKTKLSGRTIKGYGGSAAQKYASANGISFTKLTCSKHTYLKSVKKATFDASGEIKTCCADCGKVISTTYLTRVDKEVLKSTVVAYTGKACKPVANVHEAYGGKKLPSGSYTLSCPNSVNVGVYQAKVTLKGNYSGSVTVSYTVVPKAPASLKLSSSDYKTVKLTWGKVANATGYKIYRATTNKASAFKNIKTIKGAGTVSFKDTGRTPGKTYYYQVRAYQTIKTSTYNGVLKSAGIKLVPTKVTLSAAKAGSKKVTLTWKKVANITRYEVYRATSKSGSYSKVASVSAGKTGCTNTGLTRGKTYYYKVKACKVIGGKAYYGAFSAVKSAKAA